MSLWNALVVRRSLAFGFNVEVDEATSPGGYPRIETRCLVHYPNQVAVEYWLGDALVSLAGTALCCGIAPRLVRFEVAQMRFYRGNRNPTR